MCKRRERNKDFQPVAHSIIWQFYLEHFAIWKTLQVDSFHYISNHFYSTANNDSDKSLNNSNNSSIGMGRITGSASIETLVRVGIEKGMSLFK